MEVHRTHDNPLLKLEKKKKKQKTKRGKEGVTDER